MRGDSEARAASDHEARRARRTKSRPLGQVSKRKAHQARVGNRVAGVLERHQDDSFGGDVHILYDRARNRKLHWGTRRKRTNGRDIYLPCPYKKFAINVHMSLRSLRLEARFMGSNDRVRLHQITLLLLLLVIQSNIQLHQHLNALKSAS